ncbi:hypothetical protein [Amycolatopsis pretoriensis]|uniref:hypothetical protein n=1 Tax=Amycolatopsis pretoriensis TaxID=218821 RepID=UPI00115FCBAF|nr:hypothetical protein [Amycolatopsis pretoriensis]
MDATTAALVGAGIGVSGTIVAPVITAWQGRRAKLSELKRDAYSSGISAMVGIPFADEDEKVEGVYQQVLAALGDIEMHGSPRAAKLYSDVADALGVWRTSRKLEDFREPMEEFQRVARSETGVDKRLYRFRMWFKREFFFGSPVVLREKDSDH